MQLELKEQTKNTTVNTFLGQLVNRARNLRMLPGALRQLELSIRQYVLDFQIHRENSELLNLVCIWHRNGKLVGPYTISDNLPLKVKLEKLPTSLRGNWHIYQCRIADFNKSSRIDAPSWQNRLSDNEKQMIQNEMKYAQEQKSWRMDELYPTSVQTNGYYIGKKFNSWYLYPLQESKGAWTNRQNAQTVGQGLRIAIHNYLVDNKINVDDLTLKLTGYQNFNVWLARLCASDGGIVTAVSNDGEAIYHHDGIDPAALSEYYAAHSTIKGYPKATMISTADFAEIEADVNVVEDNNTNEKGNISDTNKLQNNQGKPSDSAKLQLFAEEMTSELDDSIFQSGELLLFTLAKA